jgi:adenine-specific DNA-methyltransferase
MIKAPMPSPQIIRQRLSGQLALGSDPLGDLYCAEYGSRARRDEGITLTPPAVVEWMVAHAQRRGNGVVRIVDGGAGTGRFTLAAAKAFPNAEIIAVEQNCTLADILCRNVGAAGLAKRVKIVHGDFRDLALPRIEGRTLFIGNPPYVRHHGIDPASKRWYQGQMADLGVKASQLAGLHLHFFAKALTDARAGDLVFFITAAEWLEVGYGKPLRDLILAKTSVAEVTLLDREAQVFDDAMTTSTLTLLEVGAPSDGISFRAADSIESLTQLN